MIDQKFLTPRQIVAELDKYIIGQNEAKKNVAIALRNRWRRMHVKSDMQREIVPNNILMIGATGVGKTEIARRLAKIADAPFTKVEASKFTEVGYVGRDVESMVRDLVEQSVKLVKQTKKAEVKVKAEQAVEDIILDALIPPVRNSRPSVTQPNGEIEEAEKMTDAELNERTRERFREKIRSGEIDDRKIEISIQAPQANGLGMVGGGMDEASMINLQDMLQNMLPKRSKKRKVTIEEAKKLLLEEESSKLIDMDEVKDEAIKKAENTGMIFIDEVDKIAGSSKKGGGSGPDVSREGVQRDLLPIVEGSAVNTKYGVINTDHILFIAAGAFHVAKPSDLIPELQGRFPIRVELNSLTQEHFYQILKEPKNALTKQYMALIGSEDVSLEYTDEALQEIARIAFHINEEVENIGARRLHTVMSRLLNDILFDIPEQIPPNAKVVVTKEMVQERLNGLVQNKDLSEFIL
ncbi:MULTISPECIES: ATP-dependent protease ATPase subunit HslU [Roseivirga]|jgi:ATP-dependent HslUV protease ATP-binding subunit HslU|uniref:ATP-dependent protease ATPase subunit HslU n=1 Tax=Roseivirga spongicola TaxID=333140 RepID=A0A150XHX7_9BACT|nr:MULTISPECIES: ATP-dependent protease ATPase subunit HslU [Roseivirga]PWL31082.1 MAG: ATP-dependent protease ATPase subunit HslU [Roseivirga sp. XM-24bin3]KYG78340.1 ATP-dependent protease [Roseivirga spongicola]MBO6660832.1 ATP-dependent protease ATPase subunit HslU [Roseivirga sp.]MBO6762505.1 ATP-dependent protease ATPase subunit HslU [Roseivirga sp.]MBO6909184.1 ATP-dependent protease ATPase subunit HslU [Roseivirga sp.]